jgi:SAM-dependent methyltransferase
MTDSSKVFDAYSRYYDLLYRDKDYAGEVEYIRSLLHQHGLAEGDLLEFGAGTGKHGRLLAERGYRVHGIERSAEMVAQARATEGFTIQQGDVCDVKLGKTYDAVLSLFHVVSYLTTNAALHAVFSSAANHLRQGGMFVFDFWYSPAVYAQRPAVRVKRIADETSEITRIAEPTLRPNENRVDVVYTVFARDVATGHVAALDETHPMRHFSLPEIDLLAEAHGLVRVRAEEFLSGQAPGEDTWGVCVVLRKA